MPVRTAQSPTYVYLVLEMLSWPTRKASKATNESPHIGNLLLTEPVGSFTVTSDATRLTLSRRIHCSLRRHSPRRDSESNREPSDSRAKPADGRSRQTGDGIRLANFLRLRQPFERGRSPHNTPNRYRQASFGSRQGEGNTLNAKQASDERNRDKPR